MKHFVCFCFLFLLGGILFVHAVPVAAIDPGGRLFRLVSFYPELDGLVLDAEGERIPVRTAAGFLSGPYPVPSGGMVDLGRVDPEGTFVLVAQAQIPAQIRRAVCVIIPGSVPAPDGTTLHARIQVYDDSLKTAGANTVRFLNISPSQVAASFADSEPRTLKPLEECVFPYDGQLPRARARAALSVGGSEGWQMFLTRNMATPPDARIWVMMCPLYELDGSITDTELGVYVFRDRNLPKLFPEIANP